MQENSPSAEEICVMLKRMANLFSRVQASQTGAGITGSGFLLSLLADRKEINQRELVNMMQIRSASLSEMLRKLENEGYVRRKTDPHDRRNTLVAITGKGQRRESEARGQRAQAFEGIVSVLSEEERVQFYHMLRKLFLGNVSKAPQAPS